MRRRIIVVTQSLFLLWHSLALVVGPAPGSYSMGKIYPAFKPYLEFLQMDNSWGFFSPEPGPGIVLRYDIEDTSGREYHFKPFEGTDRTGSIGLRRSALGYRLSLDDSFKESFARLLCRKHANLASVKVRLILIRQKLLSPEAYASGHRPLDEDFIRADPSEPYACGPEVVR